MDRDHRRDWRLWVDESPRPGWANMAIDQTLLDRAERLGEFWLRLYTWEPHCLSFGRHEPAARRYDLDRIAALGLDAVRRPTGGRAVWHSRELTYAVAAPGSNFGSLQEAYRDIHLVLASALLALGVPASLASRGPPARLDAGACFSQPAGGEVMAGARKVIGSAQLRRGSALLQHGSILLEDNQQVVAAVTRGAVAAPSAVPPLLSGPQPAAELTEAIIGAFQARWPGAWQRISTPTELLHAATAHYPQFRSPAWTWNR